LLLLRRIGWLLLALLALWLVLSFGLLLRWWLFKLFRLLLR